MASVDLIVGAPKELILGLRAEDDLGVSAAGVGCVGVLAK